VEDLVALIVEFQELQDQAEAVKRGATQVDDIVQQLTTQVRDLAGRWQGSASEGFQNLWDEWQRGAIQLQEGMQGIGQFLDTAAKQYQETEDSIASSTRR
jgi:WXG100 family type VII secretion target